MTEERLLKWLLLGCGISCMCGLPAVYMPREWMAVTHEWLGMGKFPEAPIAEYLARLTSGLFALYGLLVVVMATDVRRYARLITAQAIALAAVSWSSGGIMWFAGMPKWWVIGDISTTTAFAAGVLVLQRLLAAADRRRAGGRVIEL
jgi:hypothetical protein